MCGELVGVAFSGSVLLLAFSRRLAFAVGHDGYELSKKSCMAIGRAPAAAGAAAAHEAKVVSCCLLRPADASCRCCWGAADLGD